MQKAEPQHGHAQNRPAARNNKTAATEPLQAEQAAQLEAAIENSPQAEKLGSTAAMMNGGPAVAARGRLVEVIDASPRMAAQGKFFEGIHNSPRQAAQGKFFDAIHNSPHQLTQGKKLARLFGSALQRQEAEAPLQEKAGVTANRNKTGLPECPMSGIEHLSGISLDNVKAPYNSSQPLPFRALALTDTRATPGQELPLRNGAVQVAQRKVQVSTNIYKLNKRGYGTTHLIDLIKANKGDNNFPHGWKEMMRNFVRAENVEPRAFRDIDDLVQYLSEKHREKKKRKSPTEKNKEQDLRILSMNTGFTDAEDQRARILAYESEKAFGNVTAQVGEMEEFEPAKKKLKVLPPSSRSTTSDFTESSNPFLNLFAMSETDLSRLDFMAPNNVQIDTHGYSSKKDRTVDAHTLNDSFTLGTVKIGPDISSYAREIKSDSMPDPNQSAYLTALEMLRFPPLSTGTAIKRELYGQGLFSKEQAMGIAHDHTSVEFTGAISGSSQTKQQLKNMRLQQIRSNYAILKTAVEICPDTKITEALSNGKYVPTPADAMADLEDLIRVDKDPDSTQKEKDDAKSDVRKVLNQILRAGIHLEDIESEDEDRPTSPFDPNDYA